MRRRDRGHTAIRTRSFAKAAIASIKRKREFTQHIVSYVVVNAVLVGIWATLRAAATSGPSG